MSYRHIESILPEAEHYRHRPTADQMIAALECLIRHQWCAEVKSPAAYSWYRSAAEMRARLRAVPDAVVMEALERGSDAPAPDDWPEDEPEFTADLCEEVTIVSSPWLLMADHGGMESGRVDCPECGADVLGHVRQQQDEEVFSEGDKRPEFILVDKGFKVAPRDCPACGVALSYQDMVLELSEQADPAPFFHFAIQVMAIRAPSVPLIWFNPEFMDELSHAVGVPLRSIGAYS
jgi:hypothetical protein